MTTNATTHLTKMQKYPVAVFLALHGVIHAAGFAWAFQLAEFDDLGGPTLLPESSEPGDLVILAMGSLWMIAALAFIAASAGIAVDSWWGAPMAGTAAIVSLVVTALWWNDARIGAILSAAILSGVVALHRATEERRGRPLASAGILRWGNRRGTS